MKTLKSINNFNIEERQMICQIINRFGDDTHPICDEETFDGFAIDYLKSIMNKSKFTNTQFSDYANKLITSIQVKLSSQKSPEDKLDIVYPSAGSAGLEAGLEQFKCGQCGEIHHTLFRKPNNDIVAECTQCKSKSLITFTEPKIIIKFYGDSSGCLAVY